VGIEGGKTTSFDDRKVASCGAKTPLSLKLRRRGKSQTNTTLRLKIEKGKGRGFEGALLGGWGPTILKDTRQSLWEGFLAKEEKKSTNSSRRMGWVKPHADETGGEDRQDGWVVGTNRRGTNAKLPKGTILVGQRRKGSGL